MMVSANSKDAVNNVAITAAGKLLSPKTRRQSGMPMKPTFA
jgi:hypothetical protein